MTAYPGIRTNSPTFRSTTTLNTDGTPSKVVIETSEPIVLTANPDSSDPAAVILTGNVTHDLEVHGDQVTIEGHLRFPSRAVTIVARVVRGALATDGKTAPMVDVAGLDGAKPADKLGIGVSPPNSGKAKLAVGPTGSAGAIHVWYPLPSTSAKDVSGGNAATTPPEELNGEPGSTGDPGKPGGSITIIADHLTGPAIALRAYGGRGGDGQAGQDGGQGGAGGPGANAGPQKGSEITGFGLATPGGDGGTGGRGGDGGPGAQGGNGGTIVAHWTHADKPPPYSNWAGAAGKGGDPGERGHYGEAGPGGKGNPSELVAWVTGVMIALVSVTIIPEWIRGDSPADVCDAYHDDAPGGSIGSYGVRGNQGATPTSTATDGAAQLAQSTSIPAIAAGLVGDTYLQMLLDTTRAAWLANPSSTDPRSETDPIGAPLSWLFDVVEAMSAAAPDNDLIQGLHQEVWAARSNYLAGQDYFGNPPHYVPLLSVGTLFSAVDNAVTNLARIEGPANSYDAKLDAQNSALASAKGGLKEAQAAATYLQTKVDDVKANLIDKDIMPRLQQAEDDRQTSSDALNTVLESFVKETQSAFGLNPSQLLNALSTMAFSLGDGASFATQAVSQLGSLALDASKNVIDDAGDSVSKAFVVTSVRSLENGDLKATLAATADGFKDPSSSYSLLVGLGQLRTLVDNFRNSSASASAAADGVDDYIRAIQHRNNIVGEYNAAVRQLLDLRGAQQRTAAQIASTGADIENNTDPGLAAIDSYMRGLRARAQTEALRELMLAAQAASLFELAEVPLTTLGRGNPGSFDSTVVAAARGTLSSSITSHLNTIRKVLAPFPGKEDPFTDQGVQWYAPGVLVVLTPQRHPEIFDGLTTFNEASFDIDPPLPRTTEPASIDEPTWAAHAVLRTDHSTSHPFHRMANVRLSRLRVFAEGLSGTPLITLTHLGTERFVAPDGTPFPGTAKVPALAWHEPVVLGNQYETQFYTFDPTRGFDARAVRLGSSTDFGDLTTAMAEIDYAYASIGPFGAWRIAFEDDADTSSITRILIDFHGRCELMPEA